MTKAEWQLQYQISDTDMSIITIIKEQFYGTIVQVSKVQTDAQGNIVPFSERRQESAPL